MGATMLRCGYRAAVGALQQKTKKDLSNRFALYLRVMYHFTGYSRQKILMFSLICVMLISKFSNNVVSFYCQTNHNAGAGFGLLE